MKSELTRQIFEAFALGDREKFLAAAREIINEEEKKSHRLFAKDLREIIKSLGNGSSMAEIPSTKRYKDSIPIPRDSEKGFPLLEVKEFHLDWNDLILEESVKSSLKQIVEEIRQAEVFATYGLKPKQCVLFCGPPGTGKTLSSQIISSVLYFPLVYVRFDSIVSSFLGETASNLRKIFDFIECGEWVVLFDEFDFIGKQRDDPYEHGEIKRVVNNFMQMLDGFSGDSLIIAATNHQYLLDPGLWRRFDEIIHFDLPDSSLRKNLLMKYLGVMDKQKDLACDLIVKELNKFSPADIAHVCWDALKKAILDNRRTVTNQDLLLAIKEQKRRKQIEKKKDG